MKATIAFANFTAALSVMTASKVEDLKSENPNLYRLLDQTFGTGGIYGVSLQEIDWQALADLVRKTNEIATVYADDIKSFLDDTSVDSDDDSIVTRVKEMFNDAETSVEKIRSEYPIFAHIAVKNTPAVLLLVRNQREQVLQALDAYDAGKLKKSSQAA